MKYRVEIQVIRRGFIFVDADTMENAAKRAANAYMSGKTDWKQRETKVLHVCVKDKGDCEWQRMW